MSGIANRIGQWLLRIAAGSIIVLALLVGVARLLLPEASRFADDVREVAFKSSGFVVDFELLSAGVSLYGPELRLTGVTVAWPDGQPAFAADEIAVAIDMARLVARQEVAASLLHIEGLALDIEVAGDGKVLLQGRPWTDFVRSETPSSELPELRISLEEIDFRFADRKRDIEPVDASIDQLSARLSETDVEFEAELRPNPDFAGSIEVEGLVPLDLLRSRDSLNPDKRWNLQIAAEDFRLDPWLKLADLSDTPVIDSRGTAGAAVEFVGLNPVSLIVNADIDQLILAQAGGEPVVYDSVSGLFDWQREAKGWQAAGRELQLQRADRRWPESEFVVQCLCNESGLQQISGTASFLRIDDLMPLLSAFAGKQLLDAGVSGAASGDIWQLDAAVELRDNVLGDYRVAADFDELGYRDAEQDFTLAGLTGEVKADEGGGTVSLATRDAMFAWPRLFRDRLPISSLEGLAVWRMGDQQLRVIANDLYVETPDGKGTASLELSTDLEFATPQIDLSAEASMADATNALKYLPVTMPAKVLDWLDGALLAGSSPETEFRLRGPLRKFPFREDEGEFFIDIDFRDAALAFAPGWPAIEKASGHLIFDNESIYSVRNRATIGGIEVNNVDGRIRDLRQAIIEIDAEGPAPVTAMVRFLQSTPLADKLGAVFADVRAIGDGQVNASLTLPVKDLSAWQLNGTVKLQDTSVWLPALEPRFTEVQGELSVANIYVSGEGLTGRLLGEPVNIRIEANAADDANFSHRASVSGVFPYEKIEGALGLPPLGKLTGRANIKAAAMFPVPRPDSDPFRLLVHSDLEGITSSLPYPLTKNSAERDIFDAELRFPSDEQIDLRVTMDRGLSADLSFGKAGGWRLRGGRARFGTLAETPVSDAGIALTAVVDRLSIDEWIRAFSDDAVQGPGDAAARDGRWQDLFASAELMVGDFEGFGYRFSDTDVRALFGENSWDIALAGPWIEGELKVPFVLDSSAVIRGDLARLLLIEPVESAGDATGEYTNTPVDMPGFRGSVKEFALGNLRLGQLDADIRATADGLEARALDFSSPDFKARLSGDWKVVDKAQRSRLHAELESTNVERTLRQLGLAPLISAEYGSLVTDLIWEGGPDGAIVAGSTGSLNMIIRDGLINDVDAGGGRLLGLLSVAALPRRLALDFTDLTEDTLEFSKISADFRLDFGDAWTCNLAMEGDVTDMALVGRTGLSVQDYNQVAVVRPHISNLMPVPAAFLGGPTVGVAALLVSQIFKKPISGIGESYYTIDGTWDDSKIEKVQRSELDTTPFADCESQLPDLSPEELAAIQELLNQAKEPSAPVQAAPEAMTP